MARGPDGKGGGAGHSLADQLFNPRSIGQLATEYAVLPGFDPDRFRAEAQDGMASRGLLERLDWLADCIDAQLPQSFGAKVAALEQAMPPPLDPTRQDDDFGQFIHAVPGILAVRHGLEDHRDRALDLLHAATQRFSMEFYIRPFLNRWPDETLRRLDAWVRDDNYHVRRLVSEGTRPRLPWARNITLDPMVPLRFLDVLHGDPTRYVTRSVANHMNDIGKIAPDAVVSRLSGWQDAKVQDLREMAWMTRHALRTAVKRGEPKALALLGYKPDVPIRVTVHLDTTAVRIGDALRFGVFVASDSRCAVLVDYRIRFARPDGRSDEKVFKLTSAVVDPDRPVTLTKTHRLKRDASTFRWHPGVHRLTVQVNGVDRAATPFTVVA